MMATLRVRTRYACVAGGLVAAALVSGAGLLAVASCQGASGPSPTPVSRLVNPGPDAIGPQPSITCPADAVVVSPGASIQDAVAAHQGGTTFCLKAGTHPIAAAITPRTGDTFVG